MDLIHRALVLHHEFRKRRKIEPSYSSLSYRGLAILLVVFTTTASNLNLMALVQNSWQSTIHCVTHFHHPNRSGLHHRS